MCRIGRTGRAGQTGKAISLVSADEVDLLSDIERFNTAATSREEVEGYEPKHAVPETTLRAPVKPKKPRKALNRETGAGNNSRSVKNPLETMVPVTVRALSPVASASLVAEIRRINQKAFC